MALVWCSTVHSNSPSAEAADSYRGAKSDTMNTVERVPYQKMCQLLVFVLFLTQELMCVAEGSSGIQYSIHMYWYWYIPVHASTGLLEKYVLVRTGIYNQQHMNVSNTPGHLFESKLEQGKAPMQEIF